jgi:hypothetical protein
VERVMGWYRISSSVLAVVLLVAVNLVPLAGVVWWGWNLLSILALYWVENGIVGAFNALKILRAEGTSLPGMARMRFNGRPIETVARGPLAAFFVMHYGIFWAVHGLFVLLFLPLMTGIGVAGGGLPLASDGSVPLSLGGFVGGGPDWPLVGAGGAMVSIWIGSPVGALLVLVILKTVLDLFFHLREHRQETASDPLLTST